MTIQEAIKSNKPMKRKHWQEFLWIREWQREARIKAFIDNITIEDILAEDWEIKK